MDISPVFGIGLSLVSGFARYRFPTIHPRFAELGIGVGILLMIASVWPTSTRQEHSPQSAEVSVPAKAPELTVTGIPLARFEGYYESMTDAQASKLVEPFIGAPASVTGIVRDILDSGDHVTLVPERDRLAPSYFLYFEKAAVAQALRLEKEEKFVADCQLAEANDAYVKFENCRLVSP
ncbi:hypothetical protein D6851_13985 [Altericroceibacterium spongiae]|uniref:Uncharacterized protein n=1 Tax=Altericroceibacterium spongiae TaxID=2320269 RepID=A0A420EE11_9SPHN|nr:hypothetical protein [Altericroceibacterium spongiae]RKF18908.1 hypothetical protein D6851_13985 [Altericroceibacterium spongiae]